MKKQILQRLVLLVFVCLTAVGVKSESVHVTYVSNWGWYTATLNDGTVLAFSQDSRYNYDTSSYQYYAGFRGAVTTGTSVTVPDGIVIDADTYPDGSSGHEELFGTLTVEYCEWNNGSYYQEMVNAPNLTSLTLPSSVTSIRELPETLTDLHLQSATPPSIRSYYNLPKSLLVWTPRDNYAEYVFEANREGSSWYGADVLYEGWVQQRVTINSTATGTLSDLLFGQGLQWSDFYDLEITGRVDSTDLSNLARMYNLRRLDLSQTDITLINGCTNLMRLREVVLPTTVTRVSDEAFKDCWRLTTINLPNATILGSEAFYDNYSLSTIQLPSVETIGDNAFSHDKQLTSVSLPVAKTLKASVFYYCEALRSISLPAATSIGAGAFAYCDALGTISLPVAETIGGSSFYSCRSLKRVSLPAAKLIEGDAFSHCDSLQSAELPSAVKLDSDVFAYCSSLTSVTLGGNVESIGNRAFDDAPLRDLYCYTPIPFTTDVFTSHYFLNPCVLHVPAFGVSNYKQHHDWGNLFSSVEPLDGTVDVLNVNSDFTLTETDGLSEAPTLNLGSSYYTATAGHLDINTPSSLALGNYTQTVDLTSNYYRYYSEYGEESFPYTPTLITASPVTTSAASVTLKVRPRYWYFISLPFNVAVSDIRTDDGTLWVIRRYSGSNRAAMAGNTWQDMDASTTLEKGVGYILQCENGQNQDGVEFTFPAADDTRNNIFTSGDQELPLSYYASAQSHNRSWNLVGNPYPAFYDTRRISHEGIITTWRGSAYSAYSLTDDHYILRPFEAFFVQRSETSESEHITFAAAGRQHTTAFTAADEAAGAPARAPRVGQSDRQVLNLLLSGSDYTDRARVVLNAAARADYEMSCDAAKMMAEGADVPQLYVLDGGVRYAIDERPLPADGLFRLGMRFGQSGTYSLQLQTSSDVTALLTDHVTGRQTDLSRDVYTFAATAGTADDRFTLSLSGTTGITVTPADAAAPASAWYDLQGRRVDGTPRQKGVYVRNGHKMVNVK